MEITPFYWFPKLLLKSLSKMPQKQHGLQLRPTGQVVRANEEHLDLLQVLIPSEAFFWRSADFSSKSRRQVPKN